MKFLFIIPVILFLLACKEDSSIPIKNCPDIALLAGNISVEEEYEVIGSIFNTYYSDVELIHFSQKTMDAYSSESISLFLEEDEILFDSIAIEDYVLKNDISFFWNELFEESIHLINPEELLCFFIGNEYGWESYYSKYNKSSGYLEFGRPVINENNEVILEYGWYCGSLCAMGYIIILEKEGEDWIVKHRINTWIS